MQQDKDIKNKWKSTRLLIAVLGLLYIVWVTNIAKVHGWPDVIIQALYTVGVICGGYIGLNTLRPSGILNNFGGIGGQAINIINSDIRKKSPGFEDKSDPEEMPL
jgi:hypothetical protein